MNISNAHSVQVTASNVEELYKNIDVLPSQNSTFQCGQPARLGDSTQDSECAKTDPLSVDNLLSLLRSTPRELFITQVLQDSAKSRDRLESVRLDLVECLQQTEGYPFDSRACLKTRKQMRTGDRVEYKLAQDTYILASVIDGAEWDDLREVLNIPRPSKKSQSQSALDVSFQATNITELELLKKTVQGLSSDLIAIKQENSTLKSELKAEIKSMRKDLSKLETDITADLSEVRSLISTNAQSIDRICNDRSNGVANIKSDIKLLKTDVKNIQDEPIFSVSVISLGECLNKVSSFDKKINKLERRIQVEQTQTAVASSSKSDMNGLDKETPKTVSEEVPTPGRSNKTLTSAQSADPWPPLSRQSVELQSVHINKSGDTALVRAKDSLLFSRVQIPSETALDSQANSTVTKPGGHLFSNIVSNGPDIHKPASSSSGTQSAVNNEQTESNQNVASSKAANNNEPCENRNSVTNSHGDDVS